MYIYAVAHTKRNLTVKSVQKATVLIEEYTQPAWPSVNTEKMESDSAEELLDEPYYRYYSEEAKSIITCGPLLSSSLLRLIEPNPREEYVKREFDIRIIHDQYPTFWSPELEKLYNLLSENEWDLLDREQGAVFSKVYELRKGFSLNNKLTRVRMLLRADEVYDGFIGRWNPMFYISLP